MRDAKNLRCTECYRLCRYSRFHIMAGLRPHEVFMAMLQSLKTEGWKYKRRRSILGRLHAEKLMAWQHMVETCEHVGERLGIGDLVRCCGHSPRCKVQHEGVVVAVVPPMISPAQLLRPAPGVRARASQFARTRDHESYVVQSEPTWEQGRSEGVGEPALLWPPVSKIELIF